MKRAQDRVEALLAERATEGLDAAAERELEALLEALPDTDAGALERAAAAIHLGALAPRERLPTAVRMRLERTAATVRRG